MFHRAWKTFDKMQEVVKCTDGHPLLMPWSRVDKTADPAILNGMMVPTPETVTVTEAAPNFGKVNFCGMSMANLFAVATSRQICAADGTVSVHKIFFSD